MSQVPKIAITGPESTGKSWLSERLAAHYQTLWAPEYAREHVENLDRPYRKEDILTISKEQLAREDEAAEKANTYLFCDTELIVSKIWEMYKYNTCHPWIDEQIRKNRYALYLLCDIDLPWVYDPLREYPHKRRFFFDWFKREFEYHGFPYRIVNGGYDERLGNAIRIIDQFFDETKRAMPIV